VKDEDIPAVPYHFERCDGEPDKRMFNEKRAFIGFSEDAPVEEAVEDAPVLPEKKPFVCEVCGRTSTTAAGIVSHMRSHKTTKVEGA
jgi:hypothetical protein